MSQIAGKWIKDGAITASKIDTSSTFTFQGLNITQDASIAGDFTLDGTMVLPNATVNKYLYVNSSHEIEYADASGGGGGGPHHVTIDTLPVAQDTTGWRNSGFSMSADDATAYIAQDASVIGNLTIEGTVILPNATVNKFLYVNASHEVEYADATGSGGASVHGVTINTVPVAQDTTGWRNSAFRMSPEDSTAYIDPNNGLGTSIQLTTNTRNLISMIGDPAAYGNAIELSTGSGAGIDRTSSIIIEGSPYTTSTITLKTGYIHSTPDSSQNQATIVMDSRFPGSEAATIQIQTGLATISTKASMIPYEFEDIQLAVPNSFLYLHAGSGGLAEIKTTDTTYEGLGKRVDIRGGNAYCSLIGDNGGGYNTVDLISGSTDTSHSRISMFGSATTASAIDLFVSSPVGMGHIDIIGGDNIGQDVPIRITTRNSLTLLGRPITLNGDTTVSNMQVTGDIYTVPLTDYSSGASPTGWLGSLTTQQVHYTKLGKRVEVDWYLSGTSSSTGASFYLPYSAVSIAPNLFTSVCISSAGGDNTVGTAYMSGYQVMLNCAYNNVNWPASGIKTSIGHITYMTA